MTQALYAHMNNKKKEKNGGHVVHTCHPSYTGSPEFKHQYCQRKKNFT
jgi:hypothetical protein